MSLGVGRASRSLISAPHAVLTNWAAGEHPNEMLLTRSGKRLYVANANHNTVTVLDTDTGTDPRNAFRLPLSELAARLDPEQPGAESG